MAFPTSRRPCGEHPAAHRPAAHRPRDASARGTRDPSRNDLRHIGRRRNGFAPRTPRTASAPQRPTASLLLEGALERLLGAGVVLVGARMVASALVLQRQQLAQARLLRQRRIGQGRLHLVDIGGRAAQEVPVVGGHHHQGVVEHVVGLERVDELAEPAVGHRDERLVAALDVGFRLGRHVRVGHALVQGDLKVVAVEPLLAAVHLHVLVRHVKGLMRVERLDHEEEVVVPLVVLDPIACGLEGLGPGHVLLARPQLTVLLVLLAHAAVERLGHVGGLVDAAHPRVALLAAVVVPRVELLQIALATGAQVVAVVGGDVTEGALRAQALGQRHVERLDGTPGALEEVVTPGEDVAAGRHAGRGADPVVVEHAGALGERVQMGRLHVGRVVVLAGPRSGRAPSPPSPSVRFSNV